MSMYRVEEGGEGRGVECHSSELRRSKESGFNGPEVVFPRRHLPSDREKFDSPFSRPTHILHGCYLPARGSSRI